MDRLGKTDRIDPQRVSEETDNSANSYIIELMERASGSEDARNSAERTSAERRRGTTPFGDDAAQSTPIPRDSLEDHRRSNESDRDREPAMGRVDERYEVAGENRNTSLKSQPSPNTRMATFRDYRQQIGTRGAHSLDVPNVPRPGRIPRPATTPSNELRISMDLPANIGAQIGHPADEVVRARLTRRRRRLPLPFVIGFGIVSSAALCVGLVTLSIGLYNFTKLRQNRAAKSIQGLEDDLQPVFRNMTASIAAVQTGIDVLLALGGRPRGGP